MSLFLRVLAFILNIIAIIINEITNLIIPRRKPTFPPIENPILLKSVTELLTELRERKVWSTIPFGNINKVQLRKISIIIWFPSFVSVQLTSEEITSAYIERINEVNTSLNAVIEDRFVDALKEARHADNLIAKTKDDLQLLLLFNRYPLLGIPFTVKEACGVKGKIQIAMWIYSSITVPKKTVI